LCRGEPHTAQTKAVATVLIERLEDASPSISYWSAYALWRINESASSGPVLVPPSAEPPAVSLPGSSDRAPLPLVPVPPGASSGFPSTVARPPVSEPALLPRRADLAPVARPDRPATRPRQMDGGGWQPARD
jgi:hypothetical protein